MKTPYGLMKDNAGNYAINENEADTVRLIFHLYLIGSKKIMAAFSSMLSFRL